MAKHLEDVLPDLSRILHTHLHDVVESIEALRLNKCLRGQIRHKTKCKAGELPCDLSLTVVGFDTALDSLVRTMDGDSTRLMVLVLSFATRLSTAYKGQGILFARSAKEALLPLFTPPTVKQSSTAKLTVLPWLPIWLLLSRLLSRWRRGRLCLTMVFLTRGSATAGLGRVCS